MPLIHQNKRSWRWELLRGFLLWVMASREEREASGRRLEERAW